MVLAAVRKADYIYQHYLLLKHIDDYSTNSCGYLPDQLSKVSINITSPGYGCFSFTLYRQHHYPIGSCEIM